MRKHLRNGKKRMLQVALHDRQTRSCVVVSLVGLGAISHDVDDILVEVLYGESPHPPRYLPSSLYCPFQAVSNLAFPSV